MKQPTLTKEIQRRFLSVDEPIVKDDLLTISVSSEYPVERGFGKEVLSHKAGAIDLKRFNDSAPVLWSHDPKIQVGVIKRAYLEGKKLKTDIQFGNSEKAREIQADVASGIIRNVSIGYVIHEVREEDDYMLATKWEPLEASFVSIASDPTIGVSRSHPSIKTTNQMTETEIIKEKKRNIYSSFFSEDYVSKFLFKSILHHVISLEIYENNRSNGISFETICANIPKSIGSRSSIQSILNEALDKNI